MARNSMNKEAKFFCQCCGAEVPRKAKFCPKCGKFFASVLCPNCGHSGKTEDFVNGCPQCGYAVNGEGSSRSGKIKAQDSKHKVKRIKFKLKASGFSSSEKSRKGDSSLPLWIYLVSILVLALLVILLYSCL